MTHVEFIALCRKMGMDPNSFPRDGKPKSKYNNRKKEVDGIVFDSSREASYYVQLKALEKAGVITSLELQPRFLLQDGFLATCGARQRKIEYVADFRYLRDGRTIVEDVKGHRTEIYKIKKKLFLAKYTDIEFREV